jgi:hypothetical protein
MHDSHKRRSRAAPDPRRGDGATAGQQAAPPATRQSSAPTDSATLADVVYGIRQPGAAAVLATCTAQLDGLAALGSDAELHGVVIPQVTWVAAVDGIARRQSAALTVIDLRERDGS